MDHNFIVSTYKSVKRVFLLFACLEFIIETLKFIENVVGNLTGEKSCSISCV